MIVPLNRVIFHSYFKLPEGKALFVGWDPGRVERRWLLDHQAAKPSNGSCALKQEERQKDGILVGVLEHVLFFHMGIIIPID